MRQLPNFTILKKTDKQLMFSYDHTLLSLTTLHENGIRSVKDLEEVIEWEHLVCFTDDKTFGFIAYVVIGLTKNCKGVGVVMIVDDHGRFVTLDASVPIRDDLFDVLCRQ
jgi:hypothetical protein